MGYIELKAGQVALRGKIKPFQPPTGWIAASLPLSANAITFGDGKFVIVGENNNKFAYSTNGITWTMTTDFNRERRPFSAVTYGDGKFVAIAKSDYDDTLKQAVSATAYSTDGINWTLGRLPFAGDWRGITYGGGKFVAVCRSRQDGKGAPNGVYSTDGINWTEMTVDEHADDLEAVTYGNGKFVAVGYVASHTENRPAYYSTDGINWTKTNLPYIAIYRQYTDVTFGNGKFLAITRGKGDCAYSNDGIKWNSMNMSSEQSWYAATYGNDKFVAVAMYSVTGDKAGVCAYSTDGITWTDMSMPKEAGWHDVVYGNGKFVAIAGTDSAYWYGNV